MVNTSYKTNNILIYNYFADVHSNFRFAAVIAQANIADALCPDSATDSKYLEMLPVCMQILLGHTNRGIANAIGRD